MIAEAFAAETVVPKTLEEAAAAMREGARNGSTVAFFGGGTEFGYGRTPDRVGGDTNLARPDFVCVMFNPSRLREKLGKFFLGNCDDFP